MQIGKRAHNTAQWVSCWIARYEEGAFPNSQEYQVFLYGPPETWNFPPARQEDQEGVPIIQYLPSRIGWEAVGRPTHGKITTVVGVVDSIGDRWIFLNADGERAAKVVEAG